MDLSFTELFSIVHPPIGDASVAYCKIVDRGPHILPYLYLPVLITLYFTFTYLGISDECVHIYFAQQRSKEIITQRALIEV